ncbi:uncharacterized protein LOC120536428 [Polypterus senegalus]|uniref:uncharacterized protein LOC120536428 n=1 Tax=Polypterus senegalus TaxID=55291 RepID=UPI0019662C89|nr:uncharacterized protein LOC120536428 [Polypterus senegalus]
MAESETKLKRKERAGCAPAMNFVLDLLLLIALRCWGSDSALTISASNPFLYALRHDAVTLPCSFSVTPGFIDPKKLTVTWYQYDFLAARFVNGEATARKEAILFENDIRNGNASLLLSSVMKRDEGQYRCEVRHGGEKQEVNLALTIRVPPEVLMYPERVQLLSENSVTCAARSFYPKVIAFSWKRNGRRVNEMISTTPRLNPDGTYSSESVYHVTPYSRDELICVVEHEALDKPLMMSVIYVGRTITEVMTIIAVLLLLFVPLIVCWWFSVSLSPLVPVTLVHGEQGAVQFTLKGWTLQNVTLSCFVNDEDVGCHDKQSDCEGGLSLDNKDPANYTLERGPVKKGICLKETPITLRFLINKADHQGAVLRCRATHRHTKRSVERSVTLEQVCVRPRLSEIENVTENSDTKVKLQITAEDFQPQAISFSWTLGEERGTSETPEMIENPNGTFSTRSICSVPFSQIQTPGFKVLVEVEHISMAKTQKVATGDTPGIDGCPLLADIEVVKFSEVGQPCTLSCSISKFIPSAITVTWLRVQAKGDNQPVTAGSLQWNATVTTSSPEKQNNTYEVTSEVHFTPKSICELQEMAYICRVGHVTLMKKTIEKKMAKLKLKGYLKEPKLSDLQIFFTELSQPCTLSCTVTDFYPQEIKVTWLKRDTNGQTYEAGTEEWKATSAHYGPSMRRNTFELVSQVEFLPRDLTELEDVEFICRVEHSAIKGGFFEKSSSGVHLPGWLLVQQAKNTGRTAGYLKKKDKGFTSWLKLGSGACQVSATAWGPPPPDLLRQAEETSSGQLQDPDAPQLVNMTEQ